MERQYSPKDFLRHSPNALVGRYFHNQGLLLDIDFARLAEQDVDPIYDAWHGLPSDTIATVDKDFSEIHDLACEQGIRLIVEEADPQDEELKVILTQLNGFHHQVIWLFLERPTLFDTARRFFQTEQLNQRYWRARRGMPRQPVAANQESATRLETALSNYYQEAEGRGNHCKVDPYMRGNVAYFYCYPEDYGQTQLEWIGSGLHSRPHRPAFEVVFVYRPASGTLDIYARASRDTLTELQEIFARAVLLTNLRPEPRNGKVYELNRLKDKNFRFVFDPASGIRDVRVKKIRLSIPGAKGRRITYEADPTEDRDAVYTMMEHLDAIGQAENIAARSYLFPTLVDITQVGLQVTFAGDGRRRLTRSFELTLPNGCTLRHHYRDAAIRQMLIASGIDSMVLEDDENAA